MMNEQPLNTSLVGEIIEPSAVTYSFNTLGWYIVAGLVLVGILTWLIVKWQIYRKNAYRRQGIESINILSLESADKGFYEVNRLLKMMAISLYGRREVASLVGLDWFEYLRSKLEGNHDLSHYDYKSFSKAIYDRTLENHYNSFCDFSLFWIKNHKV